MIFHQGNKVVIADETKLIDTVITVATESAAATLAAALRNTGAKLSQVRRTHKVIKTYPAGFNGRVW